MYGNVESQRAAHGISLVREPLQVSNGNLGAGDIRGDRTGRRVRPLLKFDLRAEVDAAQRHRGPLIAPVLRVLGWKRSFQIAITQRHLRRVRGKSGVQHLPRAAFHAEIARVHLAIDLGSRE